MKKIIFIVAILNAVFSISLQAQDATDSSRLSKILQSYYQIKDALVIGNNKKASEASTAYIKNLNGLSFMLISQENVRTLLHDAGTIADAVSIEKQRAAFSNFSSNMVDVAKALKLSALPVYVQYCPMKKTYWLSNEKNIRNPYYGSSMLTCGKVTETVQ